MLERNVKMAPEVSGFFNWLTLLMGNHMLSRVHIYRISKLFHVQWRISQWHLNSDSFLVKKMNGFSEFKIVNYVFNEKKLTTGRRPGKTKPVIFVPCISNVSATCENDKLYISMCWARGTLKSIQYITRIYFYVFSHLRIFFTLQSLLD